MRMLNTSKQDDLMGNFVSPERAKTSHLPIFKFSIFLLTTFEASLSFILGTSCFLAYF